LDRPILTKDDKKKWMSSEAGDKNGCPLREALRNGRRTGKKDGCPFYLDVVTPLSGRGSVVYP